MWKLTCLNINLTSYQPEKIWYDRDISYHKGLLLAVSNMKKNAGNLISKSISFKIILVGWHLEFLWLTFRPWQYERYGLQFRWILRELAFKEEIRKEIETNENYNNQQLQGRYQFSVSFCLSFLEFSCQNTYSGVQWNGFY